ncbi:hypothetical protein [Streptomyces sp. S1D4-20]|uniref:hypothetical protein n=1 Tax=Streptomyces sp. S1D4-20 TaxID=2594462 RepID=UPI001F071288|nr:hypothetical protein [Streptomyces sp. S1D4-20]
MMAQHPLARCVERIDPETVYTVAGIARLLGMSVSSVKGMAGYGWLPGGRMQPHARGGRQHVWAGARLLQLAHQPLVVEYDHERYSPVTLYRVGCRCDVCTQAHAETSKAQRRAFAEETFPAQSRLRLLEQIVGGMPVAQAATAVGVTRSRVYRRADWDPDFAQELDEATWALCVAGEDSPVCGTASGYRGRPGQRNGRPACRGTACREWRRGAGRDERTVAAQPEAEPVTPSSGSGTSGESAVPPAERVPAWVAAIHGLLQWVGDGRALTASGHLLVADGLELVHLLNTGDHPHGGAGLRRLSSTRNLPNLQMLLGIAIEAGLLRRQRGRLVQVKTHARQAATAEGVHQLLVDDAQRSAAQWLNPDPSHPELGNIVLDALWATLSSHTSVCLPQLHDTLWGAVDGWNGHRYPREIAPAQAKGEFTERTTAILSDFADLWLLAFPPAATRVELTPLGRHVAGERGAQADHPARQE